MHWTFRLVFITKQKVMILPKLPALQRHFSEVSVHLGCRARWERGVLMVHPAHQDQRFVVAVAIIVSV